MAPQQRPFEPELFDSHFHDADELLKRTTVRGRGQSESLITPPRLKPLSSIFPSLAPNEIMTLTAEGRWSCWVKRMGVCYLPLQWRWGTWALSQREFACHRPLKSSARCSFLTDPWEEENRRAQGVESLSEKKAIRERREARLKHLQS